MSSRSCEATFEESESDVVGDEFVSHPQFVATRAITIAASPHTVFSWIRQMGFGKAGWYSYDLIDNLGRKSATRVHPEWQEVHSGDSIPSGPISFTAAIVNPPTAFVLFFCGEKGFAKRILFSLAYQLRDDNGSTRLVTRVRIQIDVPGGSLIAKYLLGPGDGFMVRKQLRTLALRCERS